MTSALASSFVLGRSNFDQIAPGTVVPFQVDGSFGRIQSVQLKNMCLDVEPEQPYPVDRDCNPIEDDFSTIDQAWHLTKENYLKFLDINDQLSQDVFVCLYAFGDKDAGTGFIRSRDCPDSKYISEELKEDSLNAQWEIVYDMGDPLQYKLRNKEIDMCLGEEVTQVKAGIAGRPGPARTRATWQLLDCSNAPWWKFLHLFEARDLDEKLCKYASDTDACYRYKNANRSNVPLGLFADDMNGPMSADYAVGPDSRLEGMSEEDIAYYEQYMAALKASYEYYLDPNFDPYDYSGY